MTPAEIRSTPNTPSNNDLDVSFWLREIAAQLAEQTSYLKLVVPKVEAPEKWKEKEAQEPDSKQNDPIVTKVMSSLSALQASLIKIQEECPHPASSLRYYCNSKSYKDHNYWMYWTDLYCCLCQKSFWLDGHPRQPRGAVKVWDYEDLIPKEDV